ncbi:MAG: DUF6259 domain-containing protein [Armatimonadota bacterium]
MRIRNTRRPATWAALLLPAGLAACCARAQNIVPNGDFEQGTEPWRLSQQATARGNMAAVPVQGAEGERAARVTVTTPSAPHHIQLFCDFDSALLKPRQAYRLSFLARADPPRSFSVHVLNSKAPWGSVGLADPVTAGTEWRRVELPFRAGTPREQTVRLDFFLGASAGTVWLDDVRLAPYERLPADVEPDGPALQGQSWQLELFRNGGVARFAHIPTGQVLLLGDSQAPVYEVTYQLDGVEHIQTSADARTVLYDPRGEGARFNFQHDSFQVVCTVGRDAQEDLATFSAEVVNGGEAAVTQIKYPVLHAPAALGESSQDDCILYPQCDGGLIEDPEEAFTGGASSIRSTYPGPLSCQLMAHYDGRAGTYLAAYDAQGHPKSFGIKLGFDLIFDVTHHSPLVQGADLRPGYQVVLGAFVGDWYEAAGIYRRWSSRQPWCATPLVRRQDTPDWLRRGALVTFYNPRYRDADGGRRFDADGLRARLSQMTQAYGAPVIANNRGWERYGEWTGQEYLPPFPSADDFRADAGLIRELGGRGMVMLSGYRWTIEKRLPDGSVYSSAERFEREVAPFAVHDPTGAAPAIRTSTDPKDWHGQRWVQLCRATEFAKTTIVDVAEYCVRAGYPIIHFDQEVSGSVQAGVCGSRDHGHSPGWGRWIHLELADLYRRIRQACGPLDPDFVLSMEEPNELYLPYLQLCQSRPFGLTAEFPIRKPMTRTVPLFCYLYHDQVIGWAAFYPWKSAGHPRFSLAKGFAAGLMPGLSPGQVEPMRAEEKQAYLTMVANCTRAYVGYARGYLMWGKMLQPLDLDVPTRSLNLGEKWGSYQAPAVYHSVWRLEDGRVGVVLINPETQAHSVALDLGALSEGIADPRFVLATLKEKRRLPGARSSITVPPLELVLVEITGA